MTVAVPNYNHAAYLEQSLSSIVAQSLQPDRVIIVDDASTDDSLRVIAPFLVQNPHWQLLRNEVNRGVVYGQNRVLAVTETEWISYLGADDVLHPRYVETMLGLAEREPEAGLVCACAEQFGIARTLRPIVLPRTTEGFVGPDEYRQLLTTADNFFLGTVSTYRCNAVRALGGFDRELGSFSDAMLARQLSVRHGFGFTPRVLGYWRMHGDNYSMTMSMSAVALGEKAARARAMLEAEPAGLFPQGYAELLDRRQRFGGARLVVMARSLTNALRARQIAALLHMGSLEQMWLQAMLSAGRIGTAATLAWLTLRFKPMSPLLLLTQMRARRAIADQVDFRP
ncbi:glycosyltransferase family A protein [Tardiphaga sp. 619_E2_N8_5]|uniref:glycosyltransferase family A protein n=1 Tax=unclassified Tardiphaga TaxID=2631404 RepID=UPI003F27F4CB